MTAETTAQRVLAWAAEPKGRLPDGPLWEISRLARPTRPTLDLVGRLTRRTAVSLGTGSRPFGDTAPVGAGTTLLAAAVGGRRQATAAQRVAQAIPPARPVRTRPEEARWADLVARHGLVTAALTAPDLGGPKTAARLGEDDEAQRGGRTAGLGEDDESDDSLPETLLAMSPLTAVLYRPTLRRLARGTTDAEVGTAVALLGRPRGSAALATGLAAWSPQVAVLRWRVRLLEQLRITDSDTVLDVYTLARLRHGDDWDRRLLWARRRLGLPGPPDDLAIATVNFWTPLARLVQGGTAIPDVRPLLTGYRPALEMVGYFRLLTAGTP